MTVATILLIVALIAFLVATFNVPSPINLLALGLALATAASLTGTIKF